MPSQYLLERKEREDSFLPSVTVCSSKLVFNLAEPSHYYNDQATFCTGPRFDPMTS